MPRRRCLPYIATATMKDQKTAALTVVLLVLCVHTDEVVAGEAAVCGAIIGVLLTWFGIPICLSTIGFGKTIAANSLASTLMSLTARLGSGSRLVAALQSTGTAGVSWTTVIVGGLLGALLAHFINKLVMQREKRKE